MRWRQKRRGSTSFAPTSKERKIANDSRGPDFDPTDGDRTITPEGVKEARAFMAIRFPGMEDAPLLESRVCQYENTPDHHFILDFHPSLSNVLLVGGAS